MPAHLGYQTYAACANLSPGVRPRGRKPAIGPKATKASLAVRTLSEQRAAVAGSLASGRVRSRTGPKFSLEPAALLHPFVDHAAQRGLCRNYISAANVSLAATPRRDPFFCKARRRKTHFIKSRQLSLIPIRSSSKWSAAQPLVRRRPQHHVPVLPRCWGETLVTHAPAQRKGTNNRVRPNLDAGQIHVGQSVLEAFPFAWKHPLRTHVTPAHSHSGDPSHRA